jgi:hypothetical protein
MAGCQSACRQLEAALDYVREGDSFTVTKFDRLARSVGDVLAIVSRLEAKGVSLRVLSMWDGNRISFAIGLPFVHLWCEHDGGKYWPAVRQFEFQGLTHKMPVRARQPGGHGFRGWRL